MVQILRRLDGNSEKTAANTGAINALGEKLTADGLDSSATRYKPTED